MDKRRLWLSPRALRLHAVILIVVPAFLALCVWQITRALGGNSLSWAYVFEWPIFAGYAVYMWWRFLHEPADDASATSVDAGATTEATTSALAPGADDAGNDDETETYRAHANSNAQAPAPGEDREDAELAAYNEYLAQLAQRDKATGR
jgi:DNA-binding transcriptional regulator of glucitol operon